MNLSARFLRTALTAALLCVCLAVTASASYGTGTVTASSLRLREQANTSSATLAMISRDTEVEVLENQVDGWYKVRVDGITGYMSAIYLDVTAHPAPALRYGTPKTSGSSHLNVRSGPGTNYQKLTSVPPGGIFTILGEENGWYQISYNGTEGYVSSDYVTITTAPPTPDPEPEPEPTPVPTPTPTPEPEPEPEPEIPSNPGRYATLKTNGSSLNLRAGPGLSYRKLVPIPSTAVLTIEGEDSGWYKTTYEGYTGYVSGNYLEITTSVSTGSNAVLASQVLAYAQQFLGLPYSYGSSGPIAFDCSGFTQYVFKNFNINLSRSAASQYSNGTPVKQHEIQPGDLIFWRTYGSAKTATHVGIFINGDQYIHASSSKGCITISNLSTSNTATQYMVGIRRVLN